ncbi:uncharacterized protein LOC116108661 [Pistacia vera]|uniref:uncharacterized protein LOC116108661 n=1 Tax=Pistacia vera TaxID=55513 RepID=UPI001263E42C|nr:uncharacterized protein LOC116108661 [Pistacia vera]
MDVNSLANNKPYQATLNDGWDELKNMYNKGNARALSSPLSATRDTAFHLVAFNKSDKLLHCLLKIAKNDTMKKYKYLGKNDYGNTSLHEAAANENIKAVKLLVNHNKQLYEEDADPNHTEFLEDLNKEGETPLFKVAANWRTKVIEPQPDASNLPSAIQGEIILETKPDASNMPGAFQGKILLVPKPDASNLPDSTQEETFKGEPDASILHGAIKGSHFETALHLLNLDESFAELKDKKGYTGLPISDDENSNSCLTTCLSIEDDADDEKPTRCLTTGIPIVYDVDDKKSTSSNNIYKGWLILLGKICAPLRKIYEEKRQHKLASKLTELLIEVDTSWEEKIKEALPTSSTSTDSDEQEYVNIKRPTPIPLLLAIERGIVEIVNKILGEWPKLVEYTNHLNQNILHVAIKNHQSEIFDSVKNMKIPMTRLV